MIAAKPVAVVTIFTVAGAAVAQRRVDEQQVHELLLKLRSEETRSAAADALVEIGQPAVDSTVTMLRDLTDKDLWSLMPPLFEILERMGIEAAEVIPDLEMWAAHYRRELAYPAFDTLCELAPYRPKDADRGAVQKALGRLFNLEERMYQQLRFSGRLSLGSPESWTIEELLIELDWNRAFRREVVVEELGRRGTRAAVALPDLRDAVLTKPLPNGIRYLDDFPRRAAEAMIRIAPEDPDVAIAYAYRLSHHDDLLLRRNAVRMLGQFGSASTEAVPDLVRATGDSDAIVAREAITALGMIGPAAKEGIPALETLTEHADPQIAERAKAALRQVRG